MAKSRMWRVTCFRHRSLLLNKRIKMTHLFFCCRYAGYCPQVKFRHYGATFGNATAKCFQDRRTAELNTSVMTKPGVSKDGRDRFPTMYSNSPVHLLLTIAIKRGRWCNAKNYSLFNEHKRGREVKELDQVLIFTSLFIYFSQWNAVCDCFLKQA